MSPLPPPAPTEAWRAPAIAPTAPPKRAWLARTWSIFLIVLSVMFVISAAGQHVGDVPTFRPEFNFYPLVATLVMTAASILLYWRSRYPTQVTVTLAALTLAFPTSALPALIALVTFTAVHRGWRRWLMIIAVYAATLVALYWDLAAAKPLLDWTTSTEAVLSDAARNAQRWFAPVIAALFVAPFAAFGMFRAVRIERDSARRGRAAAAQNVATLHSEVSRERDRLELARELHDTLAARLSTLSLRAGALEVSTQTDVAAIEAARALRESAQDALDDLHHVVQVMRQPGRAVHTSNELVDLRTLLDTASGEGTDLHAQVFIDDPASCHPDTAHTCYRIVQESISNARRHASGAALRLDVRGGPETGLTISATNWMSANAGRPTNQAGYGLQGMAERVAILGGAFQAGPTPDGAFAVLSWLPWQRADPVGPASTP